MKKILALIMVSLLLFSVCACESTSTVSSEQSDESAKESGLQSFKIGDEIFIKNDDGEYKFTITEVKETSDRNEFADENPLKVILVSYTYENISLSDDLYIDDMSFSAYDKNNNKMDSYPADIKYPDSVSSGRKCSAEMAFGLDSEENYVELEFYDNMFLDADCKIILEW